LPKKPAAGGFFSARRLKTGELPPMSEEQEAFSHPGKK
jgi:hypothetical protein